MGVRSPRKGYAGRQLSRPARDHRPACLSCQCRATPPISAAMAPPAIERRDTPPPMIQTKPAHIRKMMQAQSSALIFQIIAAPLPVAICETSTAPEPPRPDTRTARPDGTQPRQWPRYRGRPLPATNTRIETASCSPRNQALALPVCQPIGCKIIP